MGLQEATVAGQAPQRRTSAAMAALVAVLLLWLPTTALAAPAEDRPPAHAGSGQAPPPHAHSRAPEERPPAHAKARRASARHGGDERTADEPGSPDPPRSSSRGPAPAPPHAAPGPGASPGVGPPTGAPAPGDRGRDPRPGDPGPGDRGRDPRPGDETDPGTELDTDVVVIGPAPTPDRAPLTAGGPLLSTPTPPAPVAAPVLAPVPGTGPSGPFADLAAPGSGPGDAGTGSTGAGGAAEPGTGGPLAAPRTRPVPPLFVAPELTRRVVVPVVVLVAGLVYLLAQGRIDRRGELLLAPREPGTEHDDDVYEL